MADGSKHSNSLGGFTRRQVLQGATALGVVSLTAPAYAVGIEPNLTPRLTHYQLASAPRWPAGLELTIAVIADLHACRPWMDEERIAHVVERTNAVGADVIVLLGDYVASHRFVTGPMTPPEWAAPLQGLRAPLGAHAVLGNHDWWQDQDAQRTGKGPTASRRALEAVGIPVYENDAIRLAKDGQNFWLAGLGDQVAFAPSHHKYRGRPFGIDDLDGTLAQVTDDAPVILLAHEPDIIMDVPERITLTLSGHTHGGQVRLFGYSPVVPSEYGNRFAYGHITSPRDLIVSGGLGCSGVPVRLGVPPEIVVVKLGSSVVA